MKVSKIEIRQCNGEHGVFTELLIDGHKIHGVRRFELKQSLEDKIPTLTIDLNALNAATDTPLLRFRQEGMGEIESIKFKDYETPVKFGKLKKGEE